VESPDIDELMELMKLLKLSELILPSPNLQLTHYWTGTLDFKRE